MALGFSPLFYESEVIVMSDFEMLSIVIMIMMLVVYVMDLCKKNDK